MGWEIGAKLNDSGFISGCFSALEDLLWTPARALTPPSCSELLLLSPHGSGAPADTGRANIKPLEAPGEAEGRRQGAGLGWTSQLMVSGAVTVAGEVSRVWPNPGKAESVRTL